MEIRNLTHKKIPALSPAASAVITLAVRSGQTTEAVVCELTRKPLRLRELLLILEARARSEAGQPLVVRTPTPGYVQVPFGGTIGCDSPRIPKD